jgi:hypothetical protein
MLHRGKILVCVLSGLVLGTGAKAVVPGSNSNPYRRIVERNVFNLRGPEIITNQPPPVQLAKVTLAGVTTILGPKMAILNIPANKQGQPAESHILAEGQRDGDIEVLEINEQAGIVRITNSGTPQTLDFINNGMKPPTLPAHQATQSPATGVPSAMPIPSPGQPTPVPPAVNPQPENPPAAAPEPATPDAAVPQAAAPQVPAVPAPTPISQPQRPPRVPLQAAPSAPQLPAPQ